MVKYGTFLVTGGTEAVTHGLMMVKNVSEVVGRDTELVFGGPW
jgi:hypothetical protein